jgi:hypothetical protein
LGTANKTSYGTASQASIGTGSDKFEDRIKVSIEFPPIASSCGRSAIDDQLLELSDPSAFPEFVRQGDDEFLERLGNISPLRVRATDTGHVIGRPVL